MTGAQASPNALPGGVASWISTWAARRPDHPCVVFEDETITWRAFDRAVDRLGCRLAEAGMRPGDRVGCLLPNRPEYLVTFWAALRIGAVFVPYNVRLVPAEIAVVIEDSAPRVVVTDQTFRDTADGVDRLNPTTWLDIDTATAAAAPDARPEVPWLTVSDLAAVVYTSGTTGRSKGAMLTHGNLLHQGLNNTFGFGIGGDDRHLHVLPLCFVGGLLSQTSGVFCCGATLVLEPSFDPGRAVRRIEQHRITWLGATPGIVSAILGHPEAVGADLTSLRGVQVGGAPVPADLAQLARTHGVDLVQTYGCTEASGGANLQLPARDALRKAGSCGKPAPYDQVVIADEAGRPLGSGETGELLIRGPLVMRGYWRDAEATAATIVDGWLHTGDLARQDAEGYVTIVGRKKEVIISGGLNVYPAEVEQTLAGFPEIDEVAVVGLPDPEWGERVSAFVVLRPGAELTVDELIERCRAKLAGYRIPRRLFVVTELPRTTSGKVRKAALVESWLAGQPPRPDPRAALTQEG